VAEHGEAKLERPVKGDAAQFDETDSAGGMGGNEVHCIVA
jgi:hypothetical protein